MDKLQISARILVDLSEVDKHHCVGTLNWADNCLNTFQVASFAKWIKCTQKHAVEGKLSQKNVERACDDGKSDEPFPPKCDQKIFFFNGENEKC